MARRQLASRRVAAVVVAMALGAAACSDGAEGNAAADGPGGATDDAPAAGASAGDTAEWQPPTCEREVAPAPAAAALPPVDGVERDFDVTSFDGTRIRAHWFPAPDATEAEPAPTVLMGPGWGQPGDVEAGAVSVFGAINIASLHDAGFNVLTWDPRGFGESDGTVTINSPDHEGRDVQTLLDWVASRPGVELDGAGDPRVGMVGGSYGGGIQLVTAPNDCRVDALVPIIAWHSLRTSLYKADTPKIGWATFLGRVSTTATVDPHMASALASASIDGVIGEEDATWFEERGPGDLMEEIRVPTLLLHGTVDTLFTLDEALTNYLVLRQNGVPTGMVWYCGGHGTCLTDPGDANRSAEAAIAWLRRYVQNDESVETDPAIRLIDQAGVEHEADEYPLPAADPLTASGTGQLALIAEGGSGPATPTGPPEGPDPLRGIVLPFTPGRATNAVDVAIDTGSDPVLVVGAPEVTITYTGTTPEGPRPTRVFAQLVDDATGLVLGNQVTPIELTLDGATHETTVPLEIVSFATTPGTGITLQLVATTVAYAPPRLGGTVTFDAIDVELPVAEGVSPAAP